MSRRGVREQIFKLLFHIEFNAKEDMEKQTELYFMSLNESENAVSESEQNEITDKLNAIIAQLDEIDQCLEEKMSGWAIDRVAKVDLTILRLALYEIKYDDNVSAAIAINEAVEIAKKFGQAESSGFVNGVLSKFASE